MRTLLFATVFFSVSQAVSAPIFSHLGATDPATEATPWQWVPTGASTLWYPVGPAQAFPASEDAIQVFDPAANGRGWFIGTLTAAQETLVLAEGFTLSGRVEVPASEIGLAAGPQRSVHFTGPGDATTGRIFGIEFGSDATGNALVRLNAATGTAAGNVTVSPGFHNYTLYVRPTAGGGFSADLFVDGAPTTLTGYIGGAKAATLGNTSFVRFGSLATGGLGITSFAAVDFSIGVPPPATHPGDFDGDGDVDGADFVAWQTNFPKATGATRAQGDADADGDVDGADFVVWQTNFPFTPSGGTAATAVPEPTSLTLLFAAVALFAAVRPLVFRKNKGLV